MARLLRILKVTLGLVAAGAVFGALAGMIAFGIAALLTEGPAAIADADPSAFLLVGIVFASAVVMSVRARRFSA